MRNIIYITGGQRSGKSRFSLNMAEKLSPNPVYLATARRWDEEFCKRIAHHQAERGEHWTNIEENKKLSILELSGRVVMMDCVTLWLTNIFFDNDYNLENSLIEAKSEWDAFIKQDFTLIVVSNEIGMGVIPIDKSTRAFVDLQGWINQHIANCADTVYAMFSGIPVKIK